MEPVSKDHLSSDNKLELIIKEDEADEEKNLRLKGNFLRFQSHLTTRNLIHLMVRLRTNDIHGQLAYVNVFGYSCDARFDVINKYWPLYK